MEYSNRVRSHGSIPLRGSVLIVNAPNKHVLPQILKLDTWENPTLSVCDSYISFIAKKDARKILHLCIKLYLHTCDACKYNVLYEHACFVLPSRHPLTTLILENRKSFKLHLTLISYKSVCQLIVLRAKEQGHSNPTLWSFP